MGLTISYNFSLSAATVDQARDKMRILRDHALQLSFAQVDEIVELKGDECYLDISNNNDPHVFLKFRGAKLDMMTPDGMSWTNSTYLIGFDALVGEGCSTAIFGLSIHEPLQEVNDWQWHSYCKTQYASNPEYGGLENFVRCHLAIVHLLDEAQKLGIKCEVSDDSQYWETRNIDDLTGAVGGYNILMASIMGTMKDAFGQKGYTSETPISDYPNFEYLEAEGNKAMES